jgi:hypothetical protein
VVSQLIVESANVPFSVNDSTNKKKTMIHDLNIINQLGLVDLYGTLYLTKYVSEVHMEHLPILHSGP